MARKKDTLVRIPSLGKSFNSWGLKRLKDSFLRSRFHWGSLGTLSLLMALMFTIIISRQFTFFFFVIIPIVPCIVLFSMAPDLSTKFPYAIPPTSKTLNTSDSRVALLVDRYEALLKYCQTNPQYSPGLDVAYEAILEVGSLLQGQSADNDSQALYVEKRSVLIGKILNEVREQDIQKALEAKRVINQHKTELVISLEDFEERNRLSSLLRLEEYLKDLHQSRVTPG